MADTSKNSYDAVDSAVSTDAAGNTTVTVGVEPSSAELPFMYDEDQPNLVPDFLIHPKGKKALKEIVKQVLEDFDEDLKNSEEYRERFKSDWLLFSGDLPEKLLPYKGCANAHIPLMLENISLVSFQMYGELFPVIGNYFEAKAVQPIWSNEADIVTKHSNWQFKEQITDFPRQMHRGILTFVFLGDVSGRSYFDNKRQLNSHDILTVDDFVTPFSYTTTRPDYSDLPHYSLILKRYAHELQGERDNYVNVDRILSGDAPSWEDDPEQTVTDEVAEHHGIVKPDKAKHAPHKLIHYEGWLDLPNQINQRFCQVVVHYQTKEILKLAIHEAPNWQEKLRHQQQTAELQDFRLMQQQHAMDSQAHAEQVQAHSAQMDQAAMLGAPPGAMGMMQQGLQDLAAQAPQSPPPPGWLADPEDMEAQPEPPRKDPIYMFFHGVCIEPLVGNLGFSYGRIQADITRAVNTAFSQYFDTGTLSNAPPILTTTDVDFEKPPEFGPGKINRVRGISPEDLEKAVRFLQHPPGNPQLLENVQFLIGLAQTSMGANPVMAGAPGKSGEPFKGLATRLEQATKPMSILAQKYAQLMEQIAKNNMRLNSVHLPDDELVHITNGLQQIEPIQVGRAMYERNYKIQMSADLRFTSQAQKIEEADEAYAMVMGNPMLASNPQLVSAVTRKIFEVRGRHDLAAMVPSPEVMAQQMQLQAQAAAAQEQQGEPAGPPVANPRAA